MRYVCVWKEDGTISGGPFQKIVPSDTIKCTSTTGCPAADTQPLPRLPLPSAPLPTATAAPRPASAVSRHPSLEGPLPQLFAWLFLSLLLRRQGIFLFFPLLYIYGMLLYMGTVKFDAVPTSKHPPPPGSLYRSPQLYQKLKPGMAADNSSADAISTIWKHSYKGGEWKPCISNSTGGLPESNGYIYVKANGGLNQQRTSICNAVAVAGYLNATLVIPNFHYHSIWRDPSHVSSSPPTVNQNDRARERTEHYLTC